MTTGFKISQIGDYSVDVDDVLLRRDLFNDGNLYLSGINTYGGLGTGNTTGYSSPVTTVGGGANWKQVSTGYYHTAAIKTDGTLWTCGYNNRGQLGDNTIADKLSPITTAGGGTNWKQVSSGMYYTAAIKTDGTLWTWGYNNYGQLASGNIINRSSPVTTAGGGTNWKQVACGRFHTAAIKTDGTLWTWGLNINGQLGDNTIADKLSPITTTGGGANWKQVTCANGHTAAIKTDGTLWTWGKNNLGQLGDSTTVDKSSPVTAAGGSTNWKQVACGGDHTAAIKTDGTLWTWGGDQYGQLGDNTRVNKSSPVTTAGGGTNWKQVACGRFHTAAIKTDGTLWTCGYNINGQLGNNGTTNKSSPVTTIMGGNNWKYVSCGQDTTAMIKDNTL